jgi:GDP-L-fucose synthase
MKNIFIAGHTGLVGSSLLRNLDKSKYIPITRTHQELDLTDQRAVFDFFSSNKIDEVIVAAAKVGGIYANKTYPADFIYQNIMIASNCIHSAYETGVKKLLFLGSSCIYPKQSVIPITEDQLLSNYLEPSNAAYAIAKISGVKLCEAYRNQYGVDYHAAMPCNIYGPNDNYDLNNSHVIPAIIRKIDDAKRNNKKNVTLWGSGKPYREFLYVDDITSACYMLMDQTNPPSVVNIGNDEDITIYDLAHTIKKVINYNGDIIFDTQMPDGTFRKTMNSKLMRSYGWAPRTKLEDGLKIAYDDFIKRSTI